MFDYRRLYSLFQWFWRNARFLWRSFASGFYSVVGYTRKALTWRKSSRGRLDDDPEGAVERSRGAVAEGGCGAVAEGGYGAVAEGNRGAAAEGDRGAAAEGNRADRLQAGPEGLGMDLSQLPMYE